VQPLTNIARSHFTSSVHGETLGNAERRFQMPEVPLSETGREQAVAAPRLWQRPRTPRRSSPATTHGPWRPPPQSRAYRTSRDGGGCPAERNFGYARASSTPISRERRCTLARPVLPHRWRRELATCTSGCCFIDRAEGSATGAELILVTHGGAMSVALGLSRGEGDRFVRDHAAGELRRGGQW